jgi:hypothetical protein
MLALSGTAGILLGYILRVLIGLAQRGSIELDIKQKLLDAKERAAKILWTIQNKLSNFDY